MQKNPRLGVLKQQHLRGGVIFQLISRHEFAQRFFLFRKRPSVVAEAFVQSADFVHFFVRQFKVENVDVLLDVHRI